jgi:hypothetical protein
MLNFKTNDAIDHPILKKSSLSLMLWAGDCVHLGIPDTKRLAGYDVYLCGGYEHLNANIPIVMDHEFCICIIDIYDEQQMNKFTKLFRGKFKTINADYNGNTPTLPLEVYETLLEPGGQAFNTEGINSVVYPGMGLLETLELFGPVVPPSLKNRRRWTKSMIELAYHNNISVDQAWTSPDLQVPYYDQIRSEQNMFTLAQKTRFPNQILYFPESQVLENYWDTLPSKVLLADMGRAFNWESLESEWLNEFRPRLIEYLKAKVYKGLKEADVAHVDRYYATAQTDEARIQVLQTTLKFMENYKNSLRASIRYYDDARRPRMTFGVIFSKD